MITTILVILVVSQIGLAVDGYYREKRLKALIIHETYNGYEALSQELDTTDDLILDTQKQIKQVFETSYYHRDTVVGSIMSLGSEFRQEAAKLTEHTESLKAHGQALLDKAHVDQTNPRRVVTR